MLTRFFTILFLMAAIVASAAPARVKHDRPDPYGSPRPARNQQDVPLQTSFAIELQFPKEAQGERIDLDSISFRLKPDGGKETVLLKTKRRFASGYSGRIHSDARGGSSVHIYIDSDRDLLPATTYTATVAAVTLKGEPMDSQGASWKFRTEDAPANHSVSFDLNLKAEPVSWQGGFFTGFCKPSFCTSHAHRLEDYKLMAEAQKESPKAWSVQRDWWITGFENRQEMLGGGQPNIVREKETRRIKEMKAENGATRLMLEDFFGHEQYGIPSNRPVSEDYHPGNEVLIADAEHSTRTMVVSADDATQSILVKAIGEPAGGWKIAYDGELPTTEDPGRPGLFPPGGCHLRKFNPVGTPHYYWERVHVEEDLVHKQYGRRLHVNFCDAPGDLSVDGRAWTYPKDYAQYHEVVRVITSHFIERYGEACLDFVWAVLNEPDLGTAFWRSGDWIELQKFYDYTVDGILRAFEDHNMDSEKVFVGGLELGAIFGMNLRAWEFLAHCSPTSTVLSEPYINGVVQKGTLHYNAAYADQRLNGKRSKRVEQLCAANNGKGSPIDFLSVHTYNGSEMAANKMIRAKEMALEINPDYYADLWINTHESCPTWTGGSDPAISDGYSGNGYFATWLADVSGRLLRRASEDKRYAYGESILTFWPWQNSNFNSLNDVFRVIQVDENGDGKADRKETVPTPEFNFINLLCSMGSNYWVLPEEKIGGHSVTGFASKTDKDLRVLLYSHFGQDPQSRSKDAYTVKLDLTGTDWKKLKVTEYRFDKENNSYYDMVQTLRKGPVNTDKAKTLSPKQVEKIKAMLESGEAKQQHRAIDMLENVDSSAQSLFFTVMVLGRMTEDEALKEKITKLGLRYNQQGQAYAPEVIQQVAEKAQLRSTKTQTLDVGGDGKCSLEVQMDANGANFLVISPE